MTNPSMGPEDDDIVAEVVALAVEMVEGFLDDLRDVRTA